MNRFVVESLSIAVVLTGSALAQAQETKPAEPAAPPTTEAAGPVVAVPAPPPAAAGGAVTDGVRFRFGVDGGIGFFTVSSGSQSLSAMYYGVDLRFGAQINHLVGVYAQPVLGYYSADAGNLLASGGLVGTTVGADFTFIDRLFVGAGVGYTVYNSPGGFTPILRLGGYPLMSKSDVKARRKGLMVGADLRFTFLGEGLNTIVMPTFNIGYEAF